MSNTRMPLLFVGHGSPMNAIEDNEFSRAWKEVGKSLPRPKEIVCISAHWESNGVKVTAMDQPRTIHDFFGFPDELNNFQYPAPGSKELASRIIKLVTMTEVIADEKWGLDHGTWSVLSRLFPKADIPVVQISLEQTRDGLFHYELGRQLFSLREEGVLILGSGNIVHNLRLLDWGGRGFDWAVNFDARVKGWILADDHDPLINFQKQGNEAALSINSAEHYLPLLYMLGLKQVDERITFFAEKVWGGSVSMRSMLIS
jgi:4,5-DOPA dioxygenase extradiol